ncbi:hypothetical protein SHI21_20480 [Bacteriovorax sp. PP10]|uniref:Lipoprotein n=1 Tax=Bacteriovorax antarcticus TaxID=3088717 RepID=A0ABU5W007_9BACT|nr:hypothetical protein [Bacteriovorax sp. PP10]MEA9358626.1 hypothetical protein [Bacteriovorax sp. PP10]
MNSSIIKKSLTNLSVCLVTAFLLASCSSTNTREIAQATENDKINKNDVSKIEDGDQAPHKFHSKRFEKYQEY